MKHVHAFCLHTATPPDSKLTDCNVLQTTCFTGEVSPPSLHPGLYGTDAPESWDGLRPPPPGFHRRLLPRANRYLYAREEARLHAPDADALDRPPLR